MFVVVADDQIAAKTHGLLAATVRTSLVRMLKEKSHGLSAERLLKRLIGHLHHNLRVILQLLAAAAKRTLHLGIGDQFMYAEYLKERWLHDEPLLQNT